MVNLLLLGSVRLCRGVLTKKILLMDEQITMKKTDVDNTLILGYDLVQGTLYSGIYYMTVIVDCLRSNSSSQKLHMPIVQLQSTR